MPMIKVLVNGKNLTSLQRLQYDVHFNLKSVYIVHVSLTHQLSLILATTERLQSDRSVKYRKTICALTTINLGTRTISIISHLTYLLSTWIINMDV